MKSWRSRAQHLVPVLSQRLEIDRIQQSSHRNDVWIWHVADVQPIARSGSGRKADMPNQRVECLAAHDHKRVGRHQNKTVTGFLTDEVHPAFSIEVE